MPSTACFFNPNTGSEGLAELSKVAVEQEGDAHLLRARTPTVIIHLIPSCRNEYPSLSFRSNIGCYNLVTITVLVAGKQFIYSATKLLQAVARLATLLYWLII